MTLEINESNFDDIVNSEKPVLVDFWARWCGPCRMLLPMIEELSTELASSIAIYKCNVDENPNLAEKFGIMSIPSLLIFKNGKLLEQKTGGSSKQNLIDWINNVIK